MQIPTHRSSGFLFRRLHLGCVWILAMCFLGVIRTEANPSSIALTNTARTGGQFSFDVLSDAGQTLTIESTGSLISNQWQSFFVTNSLSGVVHITDAQPGASNQRWYRARTGAILRKPP